jgi:hypothetical protein
VPKIAPEVARARARVAGYARQGMYDAAEQAREALAAANTEAIIAKALATAPPLGADALDRIRSLIPATPTTT